MSEEKVKYKVGAESALVAAIAKATGSIGKLSKENLNEFAKYKFT